MWNEANQTKRSWEARLELAADAHFDFGGNAKVIPQLKPLITPKRIQSAGARKLGGYVDGLTDDSCVKIDCLEPTLKLLQKACPWATISTAGQSFHVVPPIGSSIEQYTVPMILVPSDGVPGDIEIFRVFPVQGFSHEREGDKLDHWELTFDVFPDHTRSPNEYCQVRPSTPGVIPTGTASALAVATPAATTATLTWTDTCSDETGWEVWQSADGYVWARVSTEAASTVTKAITALSAATKYWWRVRAIKGAYVGPFSNIAVATTPAA